MKRLQTLALEQKEDVPVAGKQRSDNQMADEIINVRARDAKLAGKVFLKTIFGGVLAIIVYFSIIVFI